MTNMRTQAFSRQIAERRKQVQDSITSGVFGKYRIMLIFIHFLKIWMLSLSNFNFFHFVNNELHLYNENKIEMKDKSLKKLILSPPFYKRGNKIISQITYCLIILLLCSREEIQNYLCLTPQCIHTLFISPGCLSGSYSDIDFRFPVSNFTIVGSRKGMIHLEAHDHILSPR